MYRQSVLVILILLSAIFFYRWGHRPTTEIVSTAVAHSDTKAKNFKKARVAEVESVVTNFDENESLEESTSAAEEKPEDALTTLSDRYIAALKGRSYPAQMGLLIQLQAHIRNQAGKTPMTQQWKMIQWDLLDSGVNFIRGIQQFHPSHCEDYKREFRMRFAPRLEEDENLDTGISKAYELLDAVCD